ncbi:MAG: hypothetical protein WCK08_19425 [Betaproteobacteria bacterium]
MKVESVSSIPIFQSASEEIKWLQLDADLGCIKTQHRLGLLYLQSACGLADLYQAYKWLFISLALGNVSAQADLVAVNARLGSDDADEAYELAQCWFEEKFDESCEGDESRWSPDLLRWRFAPSLVH